jgi:hypothetical protein
MGLKLTTSQLGYQQISAATLAAATNLTIPTADPVSGIKQLPTSAFIVAEVANVRWRDDGVAPTATVGMLLPYNTFFQYDGDLAKIQFIAASGSPILNISYYA